MTIIATAFSENGARILRDFDRNFLCEENLNTVLLFIDELAMSSSVHCYLTCGTGIFQLLVFDL